MPKNIPLEEVMRNTVGLDDGHLDELRRLLNEAYRWGSRVAERHPFVTDEQYVSIRDAHIRRILREPPDTIFKRNLR